MKTLILFSCLVLWLASCSKPKTVVVPEACLLSDTTQVDTMGKVTFTDCSKGARGTWLHIYRPGKKPLKDTVEVFSVNRQYIHTFREHGDFIAVLTATGDAGAPIDTAFVNITVKP